MNIETGLRVIVYASTWLNRSHKGKWTTPLTGTVIAVSSNRVIVKPDASSFNRKSLTEKEFWYNEAYALSYWERGHYVDMQVFKEINPPPEPVDGQLQETVLDLEKRLRLMEKKFTIILNHTSDTYAIGAVNIEPGDL